MKIKIKQNILMEHLNYVIRGISSKNIIPILNCIKFELTNDGLYLISTDNEIAIKTFIKKEDILEIKELGDILVSGKLLYEIIRKLDDSEINIEELVDSKLIIYTKNSSFTLNCNNVSDFPDIELEEKENPILLKQQVFKNIINQTIFATSTQESRPILTGVNFKFYNKKLECTATDSYRLAKKIVEIENINNDDDYNVNIPTRNLNELIRMFNDGQDNLEINIFDNKIIFKFGTIIMLSRIINGSYPDTSKLIPNDFSLIVKIKLKDFYNAIDRASLLTNEVDKNTIKFETKNNSVVISSNIPEIGYVEENLLIDKNNDSELKIAFSSKYMMDALKSLDCEYINVMFNGDVKPIIIKNPESDDLLQLILPIRTY